MTSESFISNIGLVLNFLDPDPNLHDIVLIVEEIKFYCSKKHLAKHSPVLYTQLCMDPRTKNKTEMTLTTPSKAIVFNAFLYSIHGVNQVNSLIVSDLMKLSVHWQAKVAINNCLEFLRKSSSLTTSEKFKIATECGLEEYKEEIVSKISTSKELKTLLPTNLTDLDHPTMTLLFKRSMELHELDERNQKRGTYSPISGIWARASPYRG